MKRNQKQNPDAQPAAPKVAHCAIYTRKSTEEGLEQEFNSLDAQRMSAEAYIESQRGRGWVALPDRYDDGGFTGANTDRPALQRLMDDIEAGKVDCVVVYKVDRLSRSILDFSKLIKFFDERHIDFVSVTQSFNTAESTGRLMLNILLSFAQYEREIIGERTRDKMRAARRMGRWTGGHPVLGYDVAPEGGKILVNEPEAMQVREIFRLYLERRSLMATVDEVNRRGWTTKSWTARGGKFHAGRPFDKNTMYALLRHPVYIGAVRLGEETHPGLHDGVLEKEVWEKVQALVGANGSNGGRDVRNRHGALLKGIIHCGSCNKPMIHSHTKRRDRLYRYYICSNAAKRGWKSCPTKSVNAAEIENFVLERVRAIGKDPRLKEEVVKAIQARLAEALANLHEERSLLGNQVRQRKDDIRRLVGSISQEATSATSIAGRLSELEAENAAAEARVKGIAAELKGLASTEIDAAAVDKALEAFGPIWNELYPLERVRLLQLVVKTVTYNGEAGTVTLTLHDTGIEDLANEMRNTRKETHDDQE